MRSALLSIFISALLASICHGGEKAALHENLASDKGFRDALTYYFAKELYWSPWLISSPLFEEWGFQEGYRMPTSFIGKNISGKILRYGDLYCVDFGKALPKSLRQIGLCKQQNGEWGYDYSNFKNKKPDEVVCENYKFKIPVDYTSIASKSYEDTIQIVKSIKVFLEKYVAQYDCPAGEKHFFISPLRKLTFPHSFHIYYVEGQKFIYIKKATTPEEIENLDYTGFYEESLSYQDGCLFVTYNDSPDDFDTQFEKRVLTGRADSNVIVANCVRDGKLITVTKRPPSQWSKFKAWLKANVERTPKKVD